MKKRIRFLSILMSLLLILLVYHLTAFASQPVNELTTIEDEPEKLLFCTFDEETTNISYTPITK